jgi:hypothetical protein
VTPVLFMIIGGTSLAPQHSKPIIITGMCGYEERVHTQIRGMEKCD